MRPSNSRVDQRFVRDCNRPEPWSERHNGARMTFNRYTRAGLVFAALLSGVLMLAGAAQAKSLSDIFSVFNAASTTKVDHKAWTTLLQRYVVADQSGLNRVDYARFKRDGHEALRGYLDGMQKVDVSKLNKAEQFAFWANLYNAKTIDIILEHYPVASIRDIDISPGLFSNGPWGKKVVKVAGQDLSLDDIEHKILRGIWRDPRVHYAVNCASVGCPNLAREAFTGDKLNAMLETQAKAYINSPRGVRISSGKLRLSKIYSWFSKDFGNSTADVKAHIGKYATPDLAAKLERVTKVSGYDYDWGLNDVSR